MGYAPGTQAYDEHRSRRMRHEATRNTNIASIMLGMGSVIQALGQARRLHEEQANEMADTQLMGEVAASPQGPVGKMDYGPRPGTSPAIPVDPNAPEAQGRDIGTVQGTQRPWAREIADRTRGQQPATMLENMGRTLNPMYRPQGRVTAQGMSNALGYGRQQTQDAAAARHQGVMEGFEGRRVGASEMQAQAAMEQAKRSGGITPYQQRTLAKGERTEIEDLLALRDFHNSATTNNENYDMAMADAAARGNPIPSLDRVNKRLSELGYGGQGSDELPDGAEAIIERFIDSKGGKDKMSKEDWDELGDIVGGSGSAGGD